MREYDGDVCFVCLEAQALPKKRSSSKSITQLGHRHCLSTIAFIVYSTIAFIV